MSSNPNTCNSSSTVYVFTLPLKPPPDDHRLRRHLGKLLYELTIVFFLLARHSLNELRLCLASFVSSFAVILIFYFCFSKINHFELSSSLLTLGIA